MLDILSHFLSKKYICKITFILFCKITSKKILSSKLCDVFLVKSEYLDAILYR